VSKIQFSDAISITTFCFLERPSNCLSHNGELPPGRRGDEKTHQLVHRLVVQNVGRKLLASGHNHELLAVFISWRATLVILKTKAE